ncbi:hypothetical protein BKA62DRAFT_38049 [Auriculariales sp. MPI-PUGE-AT-0066]|nr:hypothetical protein BKA62DRAFT_38049 [Auriculariales sp. MPI-PUGE-AT-0066]
MKGCEDRNKQDTGAHGTGQSRNQKANSPSAGTHKPMAVRVQSKRPAQNSSNATKHHRPPTGRTRCIHSETCPTGWLAGLTRNPLYQGTRADPSYPRPRSNADEHEATQGPFRVKHGLSRPVRGARRVRRKDGWTVGGNTRENETRRDDLWDEGERVLLRSSNGGGRALERITRNEKSIDNIERVGVKSGTLSWCAYRGTGADSVQVVEPG